MAPAPQQQDCMVFLKSIKNPMHPIGLAHGTATYSSAKFIIKFLQNYCGKTSSFVKDSTDFIQKNKHFSINPEEETLISFDVSALFTSIPVPVVLHITNSKISISTNFTNVCKVSIKRIHQASGIHYH